MSVRRKGPRVTLVRWLTYGLLWGRPIVPDLEWVWAIVGIFLALLHHRNRACTGFINRYDAYTHIRHLKDVPRTRFSAACDRSAVE